MFFDHCAMLKRCRSELKSDFIEKIHKHTVLLSSDLENEAIWKSPFNETSQTCDTLETICTEGYVWARPDGFKENATTMEYTHNATMCDSKKQYSLATSFYFLGLAFGPLVLGPLSDKFGRRPVSLFISSILAIDSFYLSITTTPFWYAVGMFVLGAGGNGFANVNVILVQESNNEKLLHLPGMMYCVYCGIANPLLALVAYSEQKTLKMKILKAFFMLFF